MCEQKKTEEQIFQERVKILSSNKKALEGGCTTLIKFLGFSDPAVNLNGQEIERLNREMYKAADELIKISMKVRDNDSS